MEKIVHYSSIESKILGLKIGRCNVDQLDESQLLSEIIESNFDICRLKIPAEEEMTSLKLHQTGLPFFFSGSIRRYKTKITQKPEGKFLHPSMKYEMYDGTQDELLKEMLIGTWGTYPLGYYRSPFVGELVNKEDEIESVFQFYKKHNLNSNYPNNSILFMNDNGRYVGFFALNILDGNLESHIGGILAPYRKDGYFLDMLRFIKNFCVDNGLQHFIFGARNENAYVQKIFQDVGFKSIGSENVFHITPLMSHSVLEKITLENILAPQNLDDYVQLLNDNSFLKKINILKKYKITCISSSNIFSIKENTQVNIHFSLPVISDSFFLAVFITEEKNSPQNKAVVYLKCDFQF